MTGLSGGDLGQVVTLITYGQTTTFVNDPNFNLAGAVDFPAPKWTCLTLVCDNIAANGTPRWREVSRTGP